MTNSTGGTGTKMPRVTKIFFSLPNFWYKKV